MSFVRENNSDQTEVMIIFHVYIINERNHTLKGIKSDVKDELRAQNSRKNSQ